MTQGTLTLQNGTTLQGNSFGSIRSIAGEIVFSTGMVGYPESLTDPSYAGQILVITYPLVGNYGIPSKIFWESEKIQVAGLIVANYIDTPSHFQSERTLAEWLQEENIPALEISDTRFLAKTIRDCGVQLAKIEFENLIEFEDPNSRNLVAEVSITKPRKYGEGKKNIIVLDCGVKMNTINRLVSRNVMVTRVPWNWNIFEDKDIKTIDGIIISNGPGDPKMASETVTIVKQALERNIPTFGICLGNQILALAAGGNTSKLKFGHRSQNQPCKVEDINKCYLTTQNHGFFIDSLPPGFKPWFTNINDGTNEGIIHESKPFMSVQFHPEATPGPSDTDWLFDFFLEKKI